MTSELYSRFVSKAWRTWYLKVDSQAGNNESTCNCEQKASREEETDEEDAREVLTEGSSSKRWNGAIFWEESVVEGQQKESLSREVEEEW